MKAHQSGYISLDMAKENCLFRFLILKITFSTLMVFQDKHSYDTWECQHEARTAFAYG